MFRPRELTAPARGDLRPSRQRGEEPRREAQGLAPNPDPIMSASLSERAGGRTWSGSGILRALPVRSGNIVGGYLRPRVDRYVFSQTETWFLLLLVKGSRIQSLQRSRKVMPASRAIRSSSDGQTYRCGDEKVSSWPSTTQ
jgi:hypothetical protein